MKKYNILLPIAGKAQRFLDEGYTMPKPLIMAKNKQVIDWAMSSFDTTECNIIFAVRLDHIHNFAIDDILKQKFGNDVKVVIIDKITRGSVETCLLAKEHINNDLPLFVYTPDVYYQPTFDPASVPQDLDGFLLTFKANSPAHSYVELDSEGHAVKTAEKVVISQNAAVGVYYYKTGKMFVQYAERLIEEDVRVKNEFYVSQVYNEYILDNKKILHYPIVEIFSINTPEELSNNEKNIVKFLLNKK